MARNNALHGLHVCVVLAAGQNRQVRAVNRVVVAWRGHVEIIQTTYGPLTGLLSPGVGMLRSFKPHHPPKRPEASMRKAAPAQLYQGFEPVSRLCPNPTSTSVRKQGRLWKHRIAVLRVVSDGVSNNTPRQERVLVAEEVCEVRHRHQARWLA
jgi:hypothetical protein